SYIQKLVTLFGECLRVIKPSGSIIFNLGDKYENSNLLLVPYRFAIAVADAHPQARLVNAVTWVKRNPTPRQFKRRLVSSTEPFFHFVKTDDYFYNLDAFMVSHTARKPAKNGHRDIGKGYFEQIAQSDLSPEQKSHAQQALYGVIQEVQQGKIAGFRMKIRGIHSEPFGGQAGGRQIQLEKNGFTIIRLHGNPIKRDVIETAVESLKGNPHPAIYPTAIVEEFLHLLTREGDVVLDPFMGAGSTAVACKRLRRHYIGYELNPDYCAYAEQRLANLVVNLPLKLEGLS
ncbi:MAG: site-specific DNA-methyltransferase, partial [Phototrophicales bacterium]